MGKKKKPLRHPDWLHDFLGVKDTQNSDLAQATGLTVRIKGGAGERP